MPLSPISERHTNTKLLRANNVVPCNLVSKPDPVATRQAFEMLNNINGIEYILIHSRSKSLKQMFLYGYETWKMAQRIENKL